MDGLSRTQCRVGDDHPLLRRQRTVRCVHLAHRGAMPVKGIPRLVKVGPRVQRFEWILRGCASPRFMRNVGGYPLVERGQCGGQFGYHVAHKAAFRTGTIHGVKVLGKGVRHWIASLTAGDRRFGHEASLRRPKARKCLVLICRRSDLNRGPADYESAALPLSYVGDRRRRRPYSAGGPVLATMHARTARQWGRRCGVQDWWGGTRFRTRRVRRLTCGTAHLANCVHRPPGRCPGAGSLPAPRGEVYSAAEWTSCGYAADGLGA